MAICSFTFNLGVLKLAAFNCHPAHWSYARNGGLFRISVQRYR